MRHLFLCTSTLLYAAVAMPAADYHFGADISGMTPGATYKDHGVEKPALQVFRDNGYNWVRYRLWHTPTRGAQNLEYVIARAKEAKKLGFTGGNRATTARAGFSAPTAIPCRCSTCSTGIPGRFSAPTGSEGMAA